MIRLVHVRGPSYAQVSGAAQNCSVKAMHPKRAPSCRKGVRLVRLRDREVLYALALRSASKHRT